MRKYTDRDKEILLFIMDFCYTKGYSPTLREIATNCYLSKNAAQYHIMKLIELGYVTATPKTPRSIVVKIAI